MKQIESKIFYILLINLLLFIIKCSHDSVCSDCDQNCLPDEHSNNCNSNCKKSLINLDNSCHQCNFDSNKLFYIIKNNQCYTKEKCDENEKIIYDSYECISKFEEGGYFELGDFCYSNQPLNTEPNNPNNVKILKCKNKYEINILKGKKEFLCLGDNQDCPQKYSSYYEKTGLCLEGICTSLENQIRIKSEIRSSGSTEKIIRCSYNCHDNEYLLIDKQESNVIYKCVDECSPLFKYIEAGEKKCINLEECQSKGFYIKEEECISICPKRISGRKCIEKCNSNLYYDSDSSNPNECKNSCGNKYIKIYNDENICVELSQCPGNKFYIDESNNKKCSAGIECSGEYKFSFEGDNQCYRQCSKEVDGNLKHFFFNSKYKCLPSCIGNSGAEFAKEISN